MDTSRRPIDDKLDAWLEEVATSLRESFTHYWPSDPAGQNDPCEQNVAIHVAHVLLNGGFSVFAESRHPDPTIGRIDLLAIEPDKEWFAAFEFKKIWSGTLSLILEDLRRLERFRLHELDEKIFGGPRVQTVISCQRGFGIVAGLLWVPASKKSSILQFWKTEGESGNISYAEGLTQFARERSCFWAEPKEAWEAPDGSRYYLLAQGFEIPLT